LNADDVSKPAVSGKWERVRRLRCGHVVKLILARYGTNGVTDDDAGRPDLMELLYLVSQAPAGAEKKVANAIELYAPWMTADESEPLIAFVMTTPDYQKVRTAEQLGQLIELKNKEREALKLWSIRPCDMTAAEFAEQSKARSRRRREAKRRQRGVKSRAEYLAELKARPKPWEGSGLSRWQWYRRNKILSDSRRGHVETIVGKQRHHPVAPPMGLHEVESSERPRQATEGKQVEGNKTNASHADRHDPVAANKNELDRVRAEMEEAWRNRHEQKKSA
jgi:hypothetical protein